MKRDMRWLDLLSELLREATPKQLKKISKIYGWVMRHVPTYLNVLINGDDSLGYGISVNRSRNLRKQSISSYWPGMYVFTVILRALPSMLVNNARLEVRYYRSIFGVVSSYGSSWNLCPRAPSLCHLASVCRGKSTVFILYIRFILKA